MANYTYNAELVNVDSTLFERSSKLTVGEGFFGCIQETPGVPLNLTSNDAYNVEWGCPLPPGPCKYCVHLIARFVGTYLINNIKELYV